MIIKDFPCIPHLQKLNPALPNAVYSWNIEHVFLELDTDMYTGVGMASPSTPSVLRPCSCWWRATAAILLIGKDPPPHHPGPIGRPPSAPWAAAWADRSFLPATRWWILALWDLVAQEENPSISFLGAKTDRLPVSEAAGGYPSGGHDSGGPVVPVSGLHKVQAEAGLP